MPRLWTDTLDEHRRAVRDATLDTAAALIAEHGLPAVTMSALAERTGIGRATLYKYFPDITAVLTAWHERQLRAHLDDLRAATSTTTDPATRLATALDRYATLQRTTHHPTTHSGPRHSTSRHSSSGTGGAGSNGGAGADLAALLHRSEHVAAARAELHAYLRELIAESAAAGRTRADVSPAELATFCLHALTAAATLPTAAATRRLVTVTLSALSPGSPGA